MEHICGGEFLMTSCLPPKLVLKQPSSRFEPLWASNYCRLKFNIPVSNHITKNRTAREKLALLKYT